MMDLFDYLEIQDTSSSEPDKSADKTAIKSASKPHKKPHKKSNPAAPDMPNQAGGSPARHRDDTDSTQAVPELGGVSANCLSVSQLSRQLRLLVEQNFLNVAVAGEISAFRQVASGHVYLRLKDEESVINAVIWRQTWQKLSAFCLNLEEGLQIIARGKVSTFGARSEYQLVIASVELAGEGALMQRYEALKKQLSADGLFEDDLKKPLPFLPQRIGIITSAQGAVIHDMLHRLKARCGVTVLLEDVPVQGVGAREAVVTALDRMQQLPDSQRPEVVILARGGGSLEDLWTFNEEALVRAVAACAIPVISAIGHEPDVTLCDFAADHRASTPTAAAEMVVPVKQQLTQGLSDLLHHMTRSMQRYLSKQRQYLALQQQKLPHPQSQLQQNKMRLDYAYERLNSTKMQLHSQHRQTLAALASRLQPQRLRELLYRKEVQLSRCSPEILYQALHAHIKRQQNTLIYLDKHLQALRPDAPLSRGFAYITDPKGQLISTSSLLPKKITIHFIDGSRSATVDPLKVKK